MFYILVAVSTPPLSQLSGEVHQLPFPTFMATFKISFIFIFFHFFLFFINTIQVFNFSHDWSR